jgi:hypothetical protein
MVEDADKGTTPRCYDEAARAALKRHVERVDQQRGVSRDVDWDALWGNLESAAETYKMWTVEPQNSPKLPAQNHLDKLTRCATTINKLRDYLRDPGLLNWDVVSSDGSRRAIKAELPERLKHLTPQLAELQNELTRQLAELQNELEAEARKLQVVLNGAKLHAADINDSNAWLEGMILDIGHRLLGPQVGRADGPLVTFLQLALTPVLGEATPPRETLRTTARRRVVVSKMMRTDNVVMKRKKNLC